jgi:hypothetical protein
MANSDIPKSASIIGRLAIQRPDGIGRITAYRGVASRGYRSDYARVLTYWLRRELPGHRANQYSMTPGTFREHLAASHRDLGKGPENGCTVLLETGIYAGEEA